MPRIDCTDPVI